jgi:hypothetical protein
MRQIPLNREILKSRLSYIEDSVKSLERFKGKSFKEFQKNLKDFEKFCGYINKLIVSPRKYGLEIR